MIEWLKSKKERVLKLCDELKNETILKEKLQKLKDQDWSEEQLKQVLTDCDEKDEELFKNHELMKLKAASLIESIEEKIKNMKFIQNELDLYGGDFKSYNEKLEELNDRISRFKITMQTAKTHGEANKYEIINQ